MNTTATNDDNDHIERSTIQLFMANCNHNTPIDASWMKSQTTYLEIHVVRKMRAYLVHQDVGQSTMVAKDVEHDTLNYNAKLKPSLNLRSVEKNWVVMFHVARGIPNSVRK